MGGALANPICRAQEFSRLWRPLGSLSSDVMVRGGPLEVKLVCYFGELRQD